MRKLRISISILLSLAALAILALAFAPAVGAGRIRKTVAPQDPDLAPGSEFANKEAYLQQRTAWTMSRRGFEPGRPFDPTARDRAIAQMGEQLSAMETQRKSRSPKVAGLSSQIWTAIGPAPIPNGQVEPEGPVSGRVIAIAVHPTNPDIVFVGSASGGLYRTLNGQAAQPTWTPLMDTIQMQSNGLGAIGTLSVGVIAISPSNPDIVYIGTGEQFTGYIGNGVYRLDNATSANPTLVGPINPVADYGNGAVPAFNLRAISQILVHPTDPGTIFVSTTEGSLGRIGANGTNPPNSIPPLGALGLYRSTNAAGAANSVTFTKLKVNDGDLPFVTSGNTDLSAMILDPSDATGNTLIAWVRSGNGVEENCQPAVDKNCAGIYRSTTAMGAATFTQQLVSLNGNSRGELTYNLSGSTLTVIAATAEKPVSVPGSSNPNNCDLTHLGLVRRSVDGGVTWPNTDATTGSAPGILRGADGFCGSQCFYDIAIAVDPVNPMILQTGGNGNYGGCQNISKRSFDGLTFQPSTDSLHPDVQAITPAPSNGSIIWQGSDGGVFRSTNTGINWSSMNGNPATTTDPTGKVVVMQYIAMATHPTDRDYMTGGTQDNGSHLKRATSDTGQWAHINYGDGGYTAIDQNATSVENLTVYVTGAGQKAFSRADSTTQLKARNSTYIPCMAGGAFNTKVDCDDSAASFYPPLVLGPGNPNTFYFATDRLYRSTDRGDTMQLVSQGPLAGNGVEVTSISVGMGNDNVRLVGMRNGKVFATTTGATTLDDVTPPGAPTDVPVAKVMVDPNNTNPAAISAYIAFGGLGTVASPIKHLWKTTNLAGGASTWVEMNIGLPDIPIDSIVVDRKSATAPNAGTKIYLGTDIGVYRSIDGGATWTVFNPGNALPVVPVFDMAFQRDQVGGARILRIATHGRGIWEIMTTAEPQVTAVANNAGQFLLQGVAEPNTQYMEERSLTTPAPANFSFLANITTDGAGQFSYTDTSLTGQTSAFYRVVAP